MIANRKTGFLAACGLLAACTGPLPGLDNHPGLEQQIMNYYDDHAEERNYECVNVQMHDITETKVVKDTPEQYVLSVHYLFSDPDLSNDQGGFQCSYFNTRVFTFDKTGGGLTLTSMSGEAK